MPPWLRVEPGALTLEVLVQPRASRNRVVGEHEGRLKLQLTAPPVDGAANAALVTFLAGLAGVPKRAVTVVRGETGRRKTVRIEGADAATLLGRTSGPDPKRA